MTVKSFFLFSVLLISFGSSASLISTGDDAPGGSFQLLGGEAWYAKVTFRESVEINSLIFDVTGNDLFSKSVVIKGNIYDANLIDVQFGPDPFNEANPLFSKDFLPINPHWNGIESLSLMLNAGSYWIGFEVPDILNFEGQSFHPGSQTDSIELYSVVSGGNLVSVAPPHPLGWTLDFGLRVEGTTTQVTEPKILWLSVLSLLLLAFSRKNASVWARRFF